MNQSNFQRDIICEARRWIDTPYHHMADVCGVGVDCAMLLVRVFCDTAHVPPFDPRPYPHDWHLHRSAERFLEWVEKFAYKIADGEPAQPADVVLFRVGRCLSHGGVVDHFNSDGDAVMIHADINTGRVQLCEVRAYDHLHAGFWRLK